MNDRQGCRSPFKPLAVDAWLRGIGLLSLIACCLSNVPLLAETESDQAQLVDCHLQLIWKSQSPRKWAGMIAVADANDLTPIANAIRQASNLTRGMLYSGGIQLDTDSNELRFAPPPSSSHLIGRDGRLIAANTTEGGIGLHVRATLSDRIIIAIRLDESDESAKPVAVPIGELLDGRSIQNQFSQDAAWTLRRVDGDRLRVALTPIIQDASVADDTPPAPNLFWDDQQGALQVTCDAAGNQTLELTCDLYRDHKPVGAKQRWTVTFSGGKANVTSPAWQPPPGDGSYETVWHLSGNKEPKSVMGLSIPTAFGDPMSIIRSSSDTPTLESRSRVVVLSRQPQHPAIELSEQSEAPTSQFTEVGRIEPFGRSWSVGKMIPIKQASQLVGVATAPELIRHPFSGATVGEIAKGSAWEHALPVGQPGKRHRIKLIMPAATPMKLGIVLQDQVGDHLAAKTLRDYTYSQTRLKTGDEPWRTVALDFFPQTTQVRIRLEDRGGIGPVVFQRIEVQQVDEQRPDAVVNPQSKTPPARTAWLQIDGATWLQQFGSASTDLFGNPTYGDSFTAAERLVRLMRRNGMNGVAMTVNQDGRALYPTSLFASDASWAASALSGQNSDEQILPILMRLLDREQIAFLPCIRMNTPLPELEQAIGTAAPESIGITPGNLWTGLSLDLSLQQASRFANLIYNPLHPRVSEACKRAVDELAELVKHHSSVRGIGMLVDQGSVWHLPVSQATMDTTTLNRFFESLPPNTIARSQLIGWIHSSGEKAFENWRRAQLHDIFIHAASTLNAEQRQLVLLTSESANPSELAELSRIENVILVGLVRRSQIEPLAVRCRDDAISAQMLGMSSAKIAQGNPRLDTAYTVPYSEAVATRSSSGSFSIRTQPLCDWDSQAFLAAKLLNRVDQRNLFLDANLLSVDEPVLARSLQEWIALPTGDYEEFNATNEPQRLGKIRTQAIGNQGLIVAVSNPSRWPIQMKFTTAGLQAVEPIRSVNKDRILWSLSEVQATLAPGELLTMNWKGTSPKIVNCSTRTLRNEEDLLQMSEVIRSLAERLPLVTEPNVIQVIDNPGFETKPAMTKTTVPAELVAVTSATETVAHQSTASLSGWMVAQYPQDCVSWDHEFVIEGAGAARMRNTDGRPGGTWMVSRAFSAPRSGRVAVSMMLRGEPSTAPEKSQPIKVRLSLEGTVAQSNLRESTIVNVPRDGRWSTVPCRVEIDQLPACGVDSLRVAIDVMTEGTVWVDDVRVADQFMTEQEQNQLQSQMYLAMGAIPKGDLMAAAKLLESHWIQELLSGPWDVHRPAILNTTEDQVSPPVTQPPQKEETPGIAERFRSWLPKPMRY